MGISVKFGDFSNSRYRVFGVICTFQSSQFFERLSMHFGVVDHIRASALSTADCRPPSWNRITDSTFVHIAYSSGSPEFTSDYSDYLGVCDFFVLYRLVVVGLFLCFPGLYFVLGYFSFYNHSQAMAIS